MLPTVFTASALIILVSLGVWQLDRLEWKNEMIERLQERGASTTVVLPEWIDNLKSYEFRRVKVIGEYLHDRELYLVNRSLNGKPGLNIITPLKRQDNDQYVLVNRGWVAFNQRDPSMRSEGQVKGFVNVEGIVRLEQNPGTFTPENEPHNNTWFFVDPSSMSASVKLPSLQGYYILAANKSPGGLPIGHQWRLDLRNEHLEYAITWFLLAVALLVIYVVYHLKSNLKGSREE